MPRKCVGHRCPKCKRRWLLADGPGVVNCGGRGDDIDCPQCNHEKGTDWKYDEDDDFANYVLNVRRGVYNTGGK